ncbi:hypothetical protein [Microcoleus sp. herbarium12]|uniref:hypothetical protein n=1 Tax=Microcoleus sp. herbarium12 TaxID=3055437 RepID=UPI002FD67F21
MLTFAGFLEPDRRIKVHTTNHPKSIDGNSNLHPTYIGQIMCGNFGFLGKRIPEDEKALLPTRVVEVFQQMGRETEIRGEQAGGGLILDRCKDDRVVIVGKKILNQKQREKLSC